MIKLKIIDDESKEYDAVKTEMVLEALLDECQEIGSEDYFSFDDEEEVINVWSDTLVIPLIRFYIEQVFDVRLSVYHPDNTNELLVMNIIGKKI